MSENMGKENFAAEEEEIALFCLEVSVKDIPIRVYRFASRYVRRTLVCVSIHNFNSHAGTKASR